MSDTAHVKPAAYSLRAVLSALEFLLLAMAAVTLERKEQGRHGAAKLQLGTLLIRYDNTLSEPRFIPKLAVPLPNHGCDNSHVMKAEMIGYRTIYYYIWHGYCLSLLYNLHPIKMPVVQGISGHK